MPSVCIRARLYSLRKTPNAQCLYQGTTLQRAETPNARCLCQGTTLVVPQEANQIEGFSP